MPGNAISWNCTCQSWHPAYLRNSKMDGAASTLRELSITPTDIILMNRNFAGFLAVEIPIPGANAGLTTS